MCVCLCPAKSRERNIVLPLTFHQRKSSWRVSQTAWWVPYSNAKWWMPRLPFSAVSTCYVQNHAHYVVHTMWLLKLAICSLIHETSYHQAHFICAKSFACRVAKQLAWIQSGKRSVCLSLLFNIRSQQCSWWLAVNATVKRTRQEAEEEDKSSWWQASDAARKRTR